MLRFRVQKNVDVQFRDMYIIKKGINLAVKLQKYVDITIIKTKIIALT